MNYRGVTYVRGKGKLGTLPKDKDGNPVDQDFEIFVSDIQRKIEELTPETNFEVKIVATPINETDVDYRAIIFYEEA